MRFELEPELIHLNHAAVAPWPTRTREAVEAFARENASQGSLNYPRWLETESRLRTDLGRLINARADDIALLKNTSEALSVVAHGLRWQVGDRIVISNEEFPSNRIVWESLQGQGVRVMEVDLRAAPSPEDALIAACDTHTRLLAISSVQYASGLRVDLERLGRFCREHDILFCIDAIQSLGALRLDVQAINADFVMADGHKWLLGPEGVALFYSTPAPRLAQSTRWDSAGAASVWMAHGRNHRLRSPRLASGRKRPSFRMRQPQHARHPCPAGQRRVAAGDGHGRH